MELSKQDYLKKALLDTQEKVRDFMNYSEKIDDPELKNFFKDSAETEGRQAEKIQNFIKDLS